MIDFIEWEIDKHAKDWGRAIAEEEAAEQRYRDRLDELAKLIRVRDAIPMDEAYRYAGHLLHGTCTHCHGAGCGECEGDPWRDTPYELLTMEFSK